MATSPSVIAQLEQARKIVLADPSHYPDIVTGITNIIGSRSAVEAQRWGSSFLAETFASPVVSGTTKEKMSVEAITLLQDWLENQGDEAVLRSAIQMTASIYPYIFRHVTNNPTAFGIWETMSALKSNILQRWDTASTGIRICCIKFVQRVVQVQTPGIIADPRRPEQNEISLAIVPRDHPIVQLPRLEAEASGLLDRLLSIFQESASDAITVDATVNCIMVLVRTRQAVSNKIMSSVLSFKPFKDISGPVSPKEKVRIRSIERTIRAFLIFYARRYPQSQFQARIQQCIDRNIAQRMEIEGGQSKKRGAPDAADGLEDAKRQKVATQAESRPEYLPMPPPPLSLGQVFTLTKDQTGSFDAKNLPLDLVQKITVALLQRIDQTRLADTVNAVRARVLELERIGAAAAAAAAAAATNAEEDDDYEPEFEPQETVEQIQNRLDAAPAAERKESDEVAEVALGSFKLAQPPPIAKEEAEQLAKSSVGRVFSMIQSVDQPSKPAKAGINRLAGSHFDNDAWITLAARLATRSPSSLEKLTNGADSSTATDGTQASTTLIPNGSLGDGIRETMFQYVVSDFRQRLGVAIQWLCEEWYNEKILAQEGTPQSDSLVSQQSTSNKSAYEVWTERILENIALYLDAKDNKYLIRFLSEIPELRPSVFTRVKSIANDPDRAGLAVNSLYYLVIAKPPAKEQALDAIEDLYHNYQGASVPAKKILLKFRPQSLGSENAGGQAVAPAVKSEGENSGSNGQSGANGQMEVAQGNSMGSGTPGDGQAVAAAG